MHLSQTRYSDGAHCIHRICSGTPASFGKLGCSQPAIFSVAQLRGSHTWWMHPEELRSRQCQLTMPEYTALTNWLPASHVRRVDETAVGPEMSAPDAGEAPTTTTRKLEHRFLFYYVKSSHKNFVSQKFLRTHHLS